MAASGVTDPVRIYVLWHSASPDGRHLAQAVYHWFRGRPDDLNEAGYGVPVHYRFQAREQRRAPPLPIDARESEITILVPLVDEHMVTDGTWRQYLRDLAKQPFHLFPVALHPAAYNLPGEFAALNYIRVDRPSDPDAWQWSERLAARRERLLSLLTQACCRLLQTSQRRAGKSKAAGLHEEEAGLPIEVFLSHAKADGVPITSALRDRLLHHGQLQVFFDESDLPFGYGYERRLRHSAGSEQHSKQPRCEAPQKGTHYTSAMIAVYTDAYAGRPWCQRELRLARAPTTIDGNQGRRWTHKPLLILDALESQRTRFLGEVGQAPVIRWDPANAGAIIDLLLREVLMTLYYRLWSHRLALPKGAHAFAGALDLHVAMHIRSKAPGPVRQIIVPPPGPALADRRWLAELLPETEIITFGDLERTTL